MFSTPHSLIILGMQWGDEGKGKIVDYLSSHADIIVRFQGGANAGHTVVTAQQEYKLNLLPSGILHDNTICVLASGVVIDPWMLWQEMTAMTQRGVAIHPQRLKIAENTTLILPSHKMIDLERENASTTDHKIGTTGRGIGPAYEDKVGRRALRLGDLAYPDSLPEKIDKLLDHHRLLLAKFDKAPPSRSETYDALLAIGRKLLPYQINVWQFLAQAQTGNKTLVYEGAQGIMLDVDHGSYPYVTSSHTIAAQAISGSGNGILMTQGKTHVLGVLKAYTTRVGSGVLPTELHDATGDHLQKNGKEKGTVTNRTRRCGWLDIVIAKQAIALAGINGVVLTKIDILDQLETIKICTHYTQQGTPIHTFPAISDQQKTLQPVYQTLPGWQESTVGITEFAQLPPNAKNFIAQIENHIGIPIIMISTSPQRNDIIIRQNHTFFDIKT